MAASLRIRLQKLLLAARICKLYRGHGMQALSSKTFPRNDSAAHAERVPFYFCARKVFAAGSSGRSAAGLEISTSFA